MIRRHKKNRKKQPEGLIVPAPLASILVLSAVFSLVYLWFNGRCEALGNQIKVLEAKKTELHKHVINEEYKWSNLKSPRNIENLLQRFNLGMTWPQHDRVVRLRFRTQEPETVRVLADRGRDVGHAGVVVND